MNISNFNGYKGEARTKAILSDSFVLIHPSIDEYGGDVLIRKIDDLNPSMSGMNTVLVQSKFIDDLKKGKIKIKREYIEDYYGVQHFGFSIIVHSGEYDDKKVIFFNSESIRELIEKGRVKLNKNNEYVFNSTILRSEDYTNDIKKINSELNEMLDKKASLGEKRKNINEFKNELGEEVYNAYEQMQAEMDTFNILYLNGGINEMIKKCIYDLIEDKTLIKNGEKISGIFNELQLKIEKAYKKD